MNRRYNCRGMGLDEESRYETDILRNPNVLSGKKRKIWKILKLLKIQRFFPQKRTTLKPYLPSYFLHSRLRTKHDGCHCGDSSSKSCIQISAISFHPRCMFSLGEVWTKKKIEEEKEKEIRPLEMKSKKIKMFVE